MAAPLTTTPIVWATGFRVDHSWIEIPEVKDERGQVRHVRGVTESPGLYLLGMTWQYTRTSALLGWVGEDAAFLADQIEATDRRRKARRAGAAVLDMEEQMSETTSGERFSTETEGLEEATSPEVVRLRDGDTHEITIKPVRKRLGRRRGADARLQRLDPRADARTSIRTAR